MQYKYSQKYYTDTLDSYPKNAANTTHKSTHGLENTMDMMNNLVMLMMMIVMMKMTCMVMMKMVMKHDYNFNENGLINIQNNRKSVFSMFNF